MASAVLAAAASAVPAVGGHHFRHLRTDTPHRIEGQGRILEHDGDLRSPHAPQVGVAKREQLAAAKADGPADDARGRGKQAEDREEERRLAAARLAQQAHDLARLDVQAHVAQGRRGRGAGLVVDGQVRDFEQARHARMIGHAILAAPRRHQRRLRGERIAVGHPQERRTPLREAGDPRRPHQPAPLPLAASHPGAGGSGGAPERDRPPEGPGRREGGAAAWRRRPSSSRAGSAARRRWPRACAPRAMPSTG